MNIYRLKVRTERLRSSNKRKRKQIIIISIISFIIIYFLFFSSSKHCQIYINKTISSNEFPSSNYFINGVNLTLFHYENKDKFSHFLSKGVIWESEYLFPMLDIMRRDPSIHFIDLGAYLGVYSLAVATLSPIGSRHVVAVEAMESTCQRFYASLLVNKLTDHVTLIHNAITNKRKLKTIKHNFVHFSESKLINPSLPRNFIAIYSDVMGIYADDLLEVIDFDKAILKIDIKGFESNALERASQIFARVNIELIIMDWMQRENPKDSTLVVRFFYDRYYLPFSEVNLLMSDLHGKNYTLWPNVIVWKKANR